MAWLDDRIRDHPKIRKASPVAFQWWAFALCYCSAHGTGGHLDDAIEIMRVPKSVVNELVKTGLWDREDDGLWVHDWQEHNDKRDDAIEKRREQARERQARHREKVRASRKVTRDSNAKVTRDIQRDTERDGPRGGAPARDAPAHARPRDHDQEEGPKDESSSLHAGATARQTALQALDDDDLDKALAELRPNAAQRARIQRAASEEPRRLHDCLRAALERGHGIEPYLDELLVNGSWPEPIPDPSTLGAGSTIEIALAWQRYVRGYDWDETFTDNDMLAELTRIRASNRVSGYLADTDALAAWESERARRYDPEPGIPGVTTTAEGATVPAK